MFTIMYMYMYIEFITCMISPIRTFYHSILLFPVPHHPQLMYRRFMRRYRTLSNSLCFSFYILCVPLLGQEVGDRFPCFGKGHAWVSAEECDSLHVSKHVKVILYTFKLTCLPYKICSGCYSSNPCSSCL